MGTGDGDMLAWEVEVHSHLGGGHVRIGIANSNFDINDYIGRNHYSVCIYPANVLQGFGAVPLPSRLWEPNTKIGFLLNRKNCCLQIYFNSESIVKIPNIPNPYDWFPAFTVHCEHDKLSLLDTISFEVSN